MRELFLNNQMWMNENAVFKNMRNIELIRNIKQIFHARLSLIHHRFLI